MGFAHPVKIQIQRSPELGVVAQASNSSTGEAKTGTGAALKPA